MKAGQKHKDLNFLVPFIQDEITKTNMPLLKTEWVRALPR